MTQLRLPQIEWPTAAVLIATLSACALIWIFAGEERAELLALVASISAPVLAIMRALVGTPPPSGPALAVLLALGASSTLSGCGSSALRTHATIGAVAAATLASTHEGILRTCTAARESCRGAEPCLAIAHERCGVAADAQDTARDVVGVYLDAIEVAALADEGGVLAALAGALEAAQRAWESLGHALGVLGVGLPQLPIGGAR